MKRLDAVHGEPATRLGVQAESELSRPGFRLTFPPALEARYWQDIAPERLLELRFIAFWGVAGYFVLGIILNVMVIEHADWRDVTIQLGGASLLCLLIIQRGLNRRAGVLVREVAMLVCCLICTLSAIVVVAVKPDASFRDFLLAIPPASFVLVFIRLRFRQALVFFVANVAVFALSLSLRPEISHSDTSLLIGFIMTLLLPALIGGHAFERVSRRVYLLRLLERLQSDALATQNVTLTGLSYTDPLTGVANRRRLDQALVALLQKPGTSGALLLVDIDHFKTFNDLHGHLAGDSCLCYVAQSLASHLRRFDLLARFGGEEFAVLLPEAHAEEAARTAERLREAIENLYFPVQGIPVSVTVSIGIALRAGITKPHMLIGAADTALYAAKHAGRNGVQAAVQREAA